ncbi:hypothetical protein PR048_000972 [Dryococelus australis]|uniref:Ubiquinone biosynthesis protein n=1 Tax=Dryococelus australis TaxID=614101 RepID=A0ABQ9IG69_9NEOP|nr:hypothetical protein PR048_000972 [Dryococelus australis]
MEPVFVANGVKCCIVLCNLSHSEQDIHLGLVDDSDCNNCEVIVDCEVFFITAARDQLLPCFIVARLSDGNVGILGLGRCTRLGLGVVDRHGIDRVVGRLVGGGRQKDGSILVNCEVGMFEGIGNTFWQKETRIFIKDAVEMRLRMIIPYMDKWSQALAIQSLPPNVPESLANLLTLVDDIWYYAGDKSADNGFSYIQPYDNGGHSWGHYHVLRYIQSTAEWRNNLVALIAEGADNMSNSSSETLSFEGTPIQSSALSVAGDHYSDSEEVVRAVIHIKVVANISDMVDRPNEQLELYISLTTLYKVLTGLRTTMDSQKTEFKSLKAKLSAKIDVQGVKSESHNAELKKPLNKEVRRCNDFDGTAYIALGSRGDLISVLQRYGTTIHYWNATRQTPGAWKRESVCEPVCAAGRTSSFSQGCQTYTPFMTGISYLAGLAHARTYPQLRAARALAFHKGDLDSIPCEVTSGIFACRKRAWTKRCLTVLLCESVPDTQAVLIRVMKVIGRIYDDPSHQSIRQNLGHLYVFMDEQIKIQPSKLACFVTRSSQRIGLAGLYKMTELYLIQDKSEDYRNTWQFLSHRSDDVAYFHSYVQQSSNVSQMAKEAATAAFITALKRALNNLLCGLCTFFCPSMPFNTVFAVVAATLAVVSLPHLFTAFLRNSTSSPYCLQLSRLVFTPDHYAQCSVQDLIYVVSVFLTMICDDIYELPYHSSDFPWQPLHAPTLRPVPHSLILPESIYSCSLTVLVLKVLLPAVGRIWSKAVLKGHPNPWGGAQCKQHSHKSGLPITLPSF